MYCTAPTFNLDTAAVLDSAADIFNAFGGVLALAAGIALGVSLLRQIKNMF